MSHRSDVFSALLCLIILATLVQSLPKFNSDEKDLKVWRVVSVSDYYGEYVKGDMHKIDGRLPTCEVNRKKGKFVSELCMAVQPRDYQDTSSSVGFQYCDCPNQYKCSRSSSLDDPFAYATIGNTQFKSCVPNRRIPVCSRKHRTVAKVWYGEELPLKILVHCRCPRNSAWGELQCTSNGRICYVLSCEKS